MSWEANLVHHTRLTITVSILLWVELVHHGGLVSAGSAGSAGSTGGASGASGITRSLAKSGT